MGKLKTYSPTYDMICDMICDMIWYESTIWYQSNTQFRSKSAFFVPCDLEIWWMTLINLRAPLRTGVTVRKHSIRVKIGNFWSRVTVWPGNLRENNRAPLLCCFKLSASFNSHQSIQTGVTVRKNSIRVKIWAFLSSVISNIHGWPWKTIGHIP